MTSRFVPPGRDEALQVLDDSIIQDRSDRQMMMHLFDRVSSIKAGGTRSRLDPVTEQVNSVFRFAAEDADPVPAGMESAREPNPANYTGSLAWGGYANGYIPDEDLVSIGNGHALEETAAEMFTQMQAAAARDGVTLQISSSYRDYDKQVWVRENLGHKVATADPGTSNHGWGRALDIKGADAQAWMRRNGARYGWVWPQWAQKEGAKSFEPWHFEWRGV